MNSDKHIHLSRRERQIMDILYQQGKASAREVLSLLPSPPSYSAVRALLSKLEDKGIIQHEAEGPKYLYFAVTEHTEAAETALKRLLSTFFDNSAPKLMSALLGAKSTNLSKEEVNQLSQMIEKTKQRGD